MKVLLVNTDCPRITTLAQVIWAWGYQVQTTTNEADAAKAVSSFRPDVIITDVQMIRDDGLDFLGRLRADGLLPSAVVLITSETGQCGAESYSCDDFWFLEKPLDIESLGVLLQRVAEQSRLGSEKPKD